MIALFWVFLMLFPGDVQKARADSAVERCQVSSCTCSVRQGQRPVAEVNTRTVNRRHAVYFREDEFSLLESQSSSLNRTFRSFGQQRSRITLIGYTDGCGGAAYNRRLAAQRVQNVKRAIQADVPNASFNIVIHGEQVSHHSAEARRVDIVIHTEDSFTTRIDRIPADVYLIDASGSMWSGWRRWTSLTNASFKPGSRIYVSMMRGCRSGVSLDSVRPQGGTEIWYSYYWVLQQMRENQTLLIISDFNSNVALTRRESDIISALARRKNINVITLRP